MKTKELILTAILQFFAESFFFCQKTDEIPDGDSELIISEITMAAKVSTIECGSYPYGSFSFSNGAETATIDWGDGTPCETVRFLPNQISSIFTHNYSDASVFCTIKIRGENITGLSVLGRYGEESPNVNYYITSLDVRKVKDLINLSLYASPIICLDVSKNTELQYFYCRSNELSSVALNALFETLPANAGIKT